MQSATGCCVRASYFLRALTFTWCVELFGNVLLWRRVASSRWEWKSNTLSCFVRGIFWLSLAALPAGGSVGLWGALSETLQSREFLKGILPHFYSSFLSSHSNLCSCFVGDTVAWGNFGLTVKAWEAWEKKKQSLWKSLFKNLPIVRGLWTPAALGW